MLVISALSLEYVPVQVQATEAGAPVNPTSDTVQMAFVAPLATPQSGDWKAASWETDSTTTPPTYRARCLVGPNGTLQLTAGLWDCWVAITDNPESPKIRVGPIEII